MVRSKLEPRNAMSIDCKSLDIIIPTYNRSALLAKTLASVAAARKPTSLEVRVIVVDNNSSDGTPAVVETFRERIDGLRYVVEVQQGRSHALNAGIRASSADLIGTIDDDEEVDGDWMCEVERRFNTEALDFLGGPGLPSGGECQAPDWLPRSHGGLIGWIVPSERDFEYGPPSHAYMVGGNAVIRRTVLDKIGLYHTGLGRTKTGANGGEDLEMFNRLIRAGAKGHYSSGLVIYHHVPAERLSRRFFRKRSFWDGVSIGFISRSFREPVPHIAGLPRYFLRMAAEGFVRRLAARGRAEADTFADELRVVELFGRAYGRFLYQGR